MTKFIFILLTITTLDLTPKSTVEGKTVEIEAIFQGNSTKALYFKNTADQKIMEFTIVNIELLSKYDHFNRAHVGKRFRLIYDVQYLEKSNESADNDGAKVMEVVERRILLSALLLD